MSYLDTTQERSTYLKSLTSFEHTVRDESESLLAQVDMKKQEF